MRKFLGGPVPCPCSSKPAPSAPTESRDLFQPDEQLVLPASPLPLQQAALSWPGKPLVMADAEMGPRTIGWALMKTWPALS